MNTKQEIVDAMNRENSGQAPPALFSQTGTYALMEASGASWPEANYNEDAMIKLALQPSNMFGLATVRIPFDLTSEAERLGCEVFEGNHDSQPAVMNSPWRSDEILDPPDLMPVDEFLSEGRCSMYVRVAERLSKEHPELFLTSSCVGPLELACHMVGMENFLMGLFTNPDPTMKWVEAMTPYSCEYAKALSEVSDNLFVITEGSEDVMDPDSFSTFAPYESKVFASIKESFSVAHVCGTTENVQNILAELGCTALSVQCFGDPQSIVDRIGDKVVVVGGVDPIDVLMQGSPEDVINAAQKAAEAGYSVITPECGVPPQTPNAKIEALSKYRE
jgi:MtaA/CmuA family methyltransferase